MVIKTRIETFAGKKSIHSQPAKPAGAVLKFIAAITLKENIACFLAMLLLEVGWMDPAY